MKYRNLIISQRGAAMIEYCLLSTLALLLLTVLVPDYTRFTHVFDTARASFGGQSTSTVIGGISRCTQNGTLQTASLFINGYCGAPRPDQGAAADGGR